MLLNPPKKKVLLWHITNKCNQSCKYCYGSFFETSYRDTYNYQKEVPLKNLLQTVDDLSDLDFHRVHICGGEPFMRKDIWPLLLRLGKKDMESFVLSNITFIPQNFQKNFNSGLFTNLSFSLDSINNEYNDWVRGNTTKVRNNIKKIVMMKKKYKVSTELGLYIVITKMNVDLLKELIDWANDIGLNYISLQLVYLPENHKYYEQFFVTNEYKEILKSVFEYLHLVESHCRIPGDALFEISKQFLSGNKISARNCFCERDMNYLFIDGIGNIKCCSTKHNEIRNILGNICIERLKDINFPESTNNIICPEFCLDCLGVWEMAHPSTFDIHL